MSKLNFTPAILVALSILLTSPHAVAQKGGPGVEQWKSFLPYNQVNSVATDGTTFFCATTSGFFTYNREDGMLSPYSKVNGMADIGMTGVSYDATTATTILAYTSSSIDLFKDGSFYNIPALKIFPVSGDKTINNVTANNGRAYLSTGVGLVILNLVKKEVKETIFFYDNTLTAAVYAALVSNDSLYAATSIGLFRIGKDNPGIQNYSSWTKLSNDVYRSLGSTNGTVYAATADSLFQVQPDNTVAFRERMFFNNSTFNITHLDAGNGGLWISAVNAGSDRGFAILRQTDGTRKDSFFTVSPRQVIQLANGDVWFGDDASIAYPDRRGLRKKTAVDRSEAYIPDGPVTNSSFDVSAYNGEFWVAHGGKTVSWNITTNRAMISRYKDDTWTNFPYIPGGEWVQDFIRVLHDPNSGVTYAASFSGGLLERQDDGQAKMYGLGYLDFNKGNDSLFMLSGLALDQEGNLWMTNYRATSHELVVKKRDGTWVNTRIIDQNSDHSAADVIIDDYGQKWFIAVENGGVVVYNDNGTIDNTSDDQYRVLRSGSNSGNLPDNNTLSIVKDKDGAIWIGTENGIGIINCADQVISNSCSAELRVVQEDQFAGYLFEGQAVRTMAVDGANRKWIGTSNGVWLLSDDAKQTIYRFTESNSPLPSNSIERINIDPVTGDVYFSTDKGLISFRSTATEGKAENDDKLYIYPNPVPSGFNGMIAVRGVAENADVRFTDISGQLVYRTQALGGQAVWNGKDYTGRKVQSGVYLVFVVNKDGTQKKTGKIIIHN